MHTLRHPSRRNPADDLSHTFAVGPAARAVGREPQP